jgi:hypothetical protein
MSPDVEKFLFEVCSKLWEQSYGLGLDDAQAVERIGVVAEAGRTRSGDPKPYGPTEQGRLTCMTKWIHCGAPRLVTDAKYAAAMMATKVTESLVDDIIIPWQSFRVELPPGLLDHDGYTYQTVLLANFIDAKVGALMLLEGTRPGQDGEPFEVYDVCQVSAAENLATLLLDREDGANTDYLPDGAAREEYRDAKARVLRLATRLIVGLLYTMQYTQHFKTAKPSLNDQRKHIRSGPPKHRTIFVGKPMKLDVRPAIRAFAEGRKHGAPAVQTLVRGHFKRQVVGVARSGRKVIWVEPYWRGPEEAPILARPYKVGPTDSGSSNA